MDPAHLILIVDDDPRGRAALETALQTEGYRVEQAAGGTEAITLARQLQPDVVLLDVMMPDMDGFDVCRVLRADPRTAEVPIILVTALDDRDALLQGIDAGADELIVKPFNRLELRTRIRSLTRLNRYRRLVEERRALESTTQGIVTVLSDILTLADPDTVAREQRARDRAMAMADAIEGVTPAELEIASRLSRIGLTTLPASLQVRLSQGQSLPPSEAALVARLPEIGYRILSQIPQFEKVAAIVRWRDRRYDGTDALPDEPRGDALPLGARVLKVATDLAAEEAAGRTPLAACAELAGRAGAYDPAILATAERVLAQAAAAPVAEVEIRAVRVKDLRCGWKLHQDLVATDGTLLLGAGHEISTVVLESIANFAALAELKEPVAVEVPAVVDAEANPPARPVANGGAAA